MAHSCQLAAATATLVLATLTFAIGLRIFMVHTRGIRGKRVHALAASDSRQRAAQLQNLQAVENSRRLFGLPALRHRAGGQLLSA